MGIRSSRPSSCSLGFCVLSVFFACAPAPRVSLQYGTEFKQAEIEKVLAENPLGASENIKITTLGQGQGVAITSCKFVTGKNHTLLVFSLSSFSQNKLRF